MRGLTFGGDSAVPWGDAGSTPVASGEAFLKRFAHLRLPLLAVLAVFSVRLQAQTAPATPAAATPTIQARSNLVIVDVVVTDRGHHAIHNLKAADFRLRENGAAQTIKSFEEHSPATAKPLTPLGPMPAGVFTNYSPAPENGAVNILLIDRLNTPLVHQPYLHDQLVGFLRKLKPGTPLAIFGLNTQLVYLQGFSSDPAVLLAAMQSKKNGYRDSPLQNPAVGDVSDSVAQSMADQGDVFPDAVIANVRQFEADVASAKTQLRVRTTLDALNVLARYLASIPGRKNLIWMSGSFPISILPDTSGDLPDPFQVTADMEDEFRATTNLLSRSQVAVYPVDARGLQNAPVFDASQSGKNYARTPSAFTKDIGTFSHQNADEHSTMNQMARDTGGRAFYNTNGLTEAVDQAVDLGSSYYTLTYTPTDPKLDGRYRSIEVELPERSADLSYRRGYYSDQPTRTRLTSSPLAPMTPEHEAVTKALVRGAPPATQILFKAMVVPAGPATEEKVAEGNVADPSVHGPFRRYSVNYAAAAQNLAVRTLAAGSYQAHLEFVVLVYSADGVVQNRFGQGVTATFSLDDLKTLQRGGLQYHQTISVPAKGEYYLRLGVHDLNADRIGTLEVPVSSVRNLAVVTPQEPVPAPSTPPQRAAPTLNAPPQN